MENCKALGISDSGYTYINMPPSENNLGMQLSKRAKEFYKTMNFLKEVINTNTIPEFQGNNKQLQFINYGSTELVYVLTVDTKKYTLLVGQPATSFGTVKKEYENLKLLGKNDTEHIVIPMYYMKDENMQKELYITPYSYQARCIGVDQTTWGMWVPEPEYHFTDFSPQKRKIINSSMISLLVKFYDEKHNLGIGSCRLTGGDFMIEKGFENEVLNYENILKKMKLIAARELISISFDKYIEKLKDEFTKITYYRTESEKDKAILINDKARSAMSLSEIEKGIQLGLRLREKNKGFEK